MSALDELRAWITDVVREEVRRALAEASAPEEYLSTRAASELAGVADGTIRRWIRDGRLVACHAGRVLRVRRRDLEQLLRDGGTRDRELSPEALARRDFGGSSR